MIAVRALNRLRPLVAYISLENADRAHITRDRLLRNYRSRSVVALITLAIVGRAYIACHR